MTITPEELDEIEARASAATPGPWDYSVTDGVFIEFTHADVMRLDQSLSPQGEGNNTFVAAARTDIPRLVAALREAWEAIEDALGMLIEAGLNSNASARESAVRNAIWERLREAHHGR